MREVKRVHAMRMGTPAGTAGDQAKDTGLVMVLVCLAVAYWGERPGLVPVAILMLLVAMVFPWVFSPAARIWFGASRLLGHTVSPVVLTVIYVALVTPVGLIRRIGGSDPLLLTRWKQGNGSVMHQREGVVVPDDLAHPY